MITLIAEPCVSKDEHARRINNLPFLLCLQKLMENILDSRSMTPSGRPPQEKSWCSICAVWRLCWLIAMNMLYISCVLAIS